MPTDWDLCFLCQGEKTKEGLRSEPDTRKAIVARLERFLNIDPLIFDISRIDDGSGVLQTLMANNAVYHKSCHDKYNERQYQRLVKKKEKQEEEDARASSIPNVPHKRKKTDLGKAVCLFCNNEDLKENLCAAGEFHSGSNASASSNEHVDSLTNSWKQMALELGELDIHARLCIGDVRSNEIYYHNNSTCYINFRNRHRDSVSRQKENLNSKRETILLECYAWSQLSNYVHESTEPFLDVIDLENKYIDLMKAYSVPYSPHVTRFLKKLKEKVPGLNDQKFGNKLYVSFKTKTAKEAETLLKPPSLLEALEQITRQIRNKLKDTISKHDDFSGSFDEEISMPSELLVLLNLLLYGSSFDDTGFSLPVKTLAQIILFNFKNKMTTSSHRRHNVDKESPFLLYIGLKVYAVTRSRILIDILHGHGLSVSYERILRVTQGMSEASLRLFEEEGAVVPGNLRTGLFTIGAKDNIDKNARCTISKSHYHGTSLSLFQFPSASNKGLERRYEKYVNVSSGSKKVRELPSFYTDIDEIKDPSSTFFLSVPTVNIPYEKYGSTVVLDEARNKDVQWLSYVASISDFRPNTSWSVYNAWQDKSEVVPILDSIMPLIRENVASFSTQNHCIDVTRSAVELLNPGQITVDASDQPVYALSRRLQQIFPEKYGPGKYLAIFGGLHIEKLLLEIHGQLIAGSGLDIFIKKAQLSITGADNVVLNVPQITSARYLIQVSLCAEFKAMKLAYDNSETNLDFEMWMDERATTSAMFHYWKIIFDFQLLILHFIRSERERNFDLYVHVLKASMKYIFALNHYNYARWLSIHVDDLMKLECTCPEIYEEFCCGNFVIRKTNNPFSAIAIDQAHEQNNAIIKGVGGAVGLLSEDLDAALRRWEVAGPEVCRLLLEYERLNELSPDPCIGKHHEDYPAFQKSFFSDVNKLYELFESNRNPFVEESLMALHTGEMMNPKIELCLATLLEVNEERYQNFCKHRINLCDTAITAPIKNNDLVLPSSLLSNNEKMNVRNAQMKKEERFAKAAQIGFFYRDQAVKECFKYEITEFPSSLTNGGKMYHSTKSDLLTRLKQIQGALSEPKRDEEHAVIFDLSVIINALSNRKSIKPKTIGEFCSKLVFQELDNQSKGSTRIDIVTDLYPDGITLKEMTQTSRGVGMRVNFDRDTKFPNDFSTDFLRTTENKRAFYPFLVELILDQCHFHSKIVVATKEEKVITNLEGTLAEIEMPDCFHPEADTRIILHVIDCIERGILRIYVRTNDTDVVVLLVAFMPDFLDIRDDVKIYATCGVGSGKYSLLINIIADYINLKRCKEMLFLHALSGSDYTASFYQVGKAKFWNAWLTSSENTSKIFLRLSDPCLTSPLEEDDISAIEQFIISLYTDNSIPSIDLARYDIFKYKGNRDLRALPPTRDALVQHIHKAAYVASHIWSRANLPNTSDEPPSNWTWKISEGKFSCMWLSPNNTSLPETLFKKTFNKCGCRSNCTKNCSCKRENKNNLCLATCKCRSKCEVANS